MRIPLLRPCVILACAAALYLSTPSNNAAAEIVTEVLVRGLDTPWALDFAPDGRIFISERPGRIRVVEHGQLRPEPWMELEVTATGEAGLLGIAVDPQFLKTVSSMPPTATGSALFLCVIVSCACVKIRKPPQVFSIKFSSTMSPARAIMTATG
jgi:hypothetical protein